MLTYSSLTGALAAERERALREKARTAWKRRQRGELQIRAATDADAPALLRLARLDSSRPPAGSIVVAEDRGVLVAAMSIDDGATIADPFRATAAIVAMLRLRSQQIRGETPRAQRRTLLSLRRLRSGGAAA
jgi:hypothetical protein